MFIRWESKNLHAICLKPTVDEQFVKNSNTYLRLFWLGSQTDLNPQNFDKNLKESGAALFFQNWFVYFKKNIKFF